MKGPLFVYMATITAIGSALFYPYVAVLVYIMFAVMCPNALWYWSLAPTFFNSGFGFSAVVAYPMIAGWLLNGCGNIKIGKAYFPMVLLVLYLLWLISVSFVVGVSPLGKETIIMLVRLTLAMIITLTLCNTLFGLRCLIWSIIFASGFVAYELNMSYFSGFNRLQMVGFAGMDNNFFAVGLVVGSTISFYTGLAELSKRNYILMLLAFAAALLQAHAIMFSMSRGGMLGLIVVGIVTLILFIIAFFQTKKLRDLSLLLIAILVALALAGPSVRERFASSFRKSEDLDNSAQSRIKSWKNCQIVIQEHPFLGIGIQNWAPYSTRRFGLFLEAHSTWFQAAAETGIPGCLLQLSFIFVTMWRTLKVAWGRIPLRDPSMRYYGQMVVAAMSGYFISAALVSLYFLEIVYYTCLIGLCCLKLSHLLVLETEDKKIEAIMRGEEFPEEEPEEEKPSSQWATA